MKLSEIATKIDKSKKNEQHVNTEKLGYEFGLNLDWIEQERLKSYWVGNWYCTDSYVGYRMYFLDDEPVAFSIQRGRKCDENFKWFSKESALKTKEYLVSLMMKDEDEINVDLCDINEEVGNCYKIEFNSEILNYNNAMLVGEDVKILERIKETPDYGIDQMLKIQLQNGEEKIVSVRDLDFKFHIMEDLT